MDADLTRSHGWVTGESEEAAFREPLLAINTIAMTIICVFLNHGVDVCAFLHELFEGACACAELYYHIVSYSLI
jgi:hypothetical protein